MSQPLYLTPTEEARLMRLVGEAFDLRESPYYIDALKAIEAWYFDLKPERLERLAKAAS